MIKTTIPSNNWIFDGGHYVGPTANGDRMTGGPTKGYWQVNATHIKTGIVRSGNGDNYVDACLKCIEHVVEQDNVASSIAVTFCKAMGYSVDLAKDYEDQAFQHIAWHKALKAHGEFYQ